MKEEGGFVKNENNWVFQIETFNTNGLLGSNIFLFTAKQNI